MLKEFHAAMSEGVTINMTIVKKGDELIVAVFPKTKADSAYENLPPFTASGVPEEAEKQLIESIMKPIAEFSTTVSGVEEFNKAKKEADKEAAPAKDEKKKGEKKKLAETKKEAASKSKPKSEGSTAESEEEEAEESPKDPNFVKVEEMLAEGKIAVSMKRGISAKSIRAKIANLMQESAHLSEGPLEIQVKEFAKSVSLLTGEVDMFADQSPAVVQTEIPQAD